MDNLPSTGEGRIICVNSRKYDGRVRRSWSAGLVSHSESQIVLIGRFETDVEHNDIGLIREGTVSFEHFWLDRWYNVFRFHEPDGALKCHYCNIAMPAAFNGETIDYVDLDIDVIRWPDGRVEVLDRDDLEKNGVKFGYPNEVRLRVEKSLSHVLELIDRGEFPFEVES